MRHLTAAVAMSLLLGSGGWCDEIAAEADSASKIAEAWWYAGDGKSRDGDQSTQSTGTGTKEGDFFALTGSLVNSGSYEDAWNFYAVKCGADEKFDEAVRRIVGKPAKDGRFYTIFQRIDEGHRSTTFASHDEHVTVTIRLDEITATDAKTVLQLCVVAVQH